MEIPAFNYALYFFSQIFLMYGISGIVWMSSVRKHPSGLVAFVNIREDYYTTFGMERDKRSASMMTVNIWDRQRREKTLNVR